MLYLGVFVSNPFILYHPIGPWMLPFRYVRLDFFRIMGLAFVPAFRPQDNHWGAPSCVQIYPRCSALAPSFLLFSFYTIQSGVGCVLFVTDPTRRLLSHGI
ncbi:hypothetical protein FPV67DRAFT_1490181, partial [Lyophyllum atratum]